MLAVDRNVTRQDLARAIEQRIRERTWSRIHRLEVELLGDRAIVHGCTSSYHAKQLALAGAQEVLESTPVELDIRVRPNDRNLRGRYA